MRARLLFALALILALFGASELPASAYYAVPPDARHVKFFTAAICVGSTLPAASYPVGAQAQAWNVAVNNGTGTPTLGLDFSTNCHADGYYDRQIMVVGTFSNSNLGTCIYYTNTDWFPFGDGSSMNYWNPGSVGVYINVGIPGCVSTAQRRAHQVAAGIGYALGMAELHTSGWASRVMCTCSLDTVRTPSAAEGNTMWMMYNGYYGG